MVATITVMSLGLRSITNGMYKHDSAVCVDSSFACFGFPDLPLGAKAHVAGVTRISTITWIACLVSLRARTDVGLSYCLLMCGQWPACVRLRCARTYIYRLTWIGS